VIPIPEEKLAILRKTGSSDVQELVEEVLGLRAQVAAMRSRPTCSECGAPATCGIGQTDPNDPNVATLVSFCETHRPRVPSANRTR
jgi:hypothetical protein